MVSMILLRRRSIFIFVCLLCILLTFVYLTLRTDQNEVKRLKLNVITKKFSAADIAHGSYAYTTPDVSTNGTNRVWKNTLKCLNMTNMAQTVLERSLALHNAQCLYNEYRKVIPDRFLSNYSNHCWRTRFNVMSLPGGHFQGQLGPVKLSGGLSQGPKSLGGPLQELKSPLFKGEFSTRLVCLPKIFLIGFPKCGSTFFWCFMKTLLRLATNTTTDYAIEIVKEPHFWVKGAANKTQYMKTPVAKDISEYLLNFLPGLKRLRDDANFFDTPFVDGSPNTIFNWPRFDLKQPSDVNYCIIPSVLPQLLPGSKYVVVMRNPIKMLYSSFWFSCTGLGHTLSTEVQEKAPLIFHKRTKSKIDRFLSCLVDTKHPQPCSIKDKESYSVCIQQRLHLLDRCVIEISYIHFEEPMPDCGKARIETVIFYVHIRKWLSVVPRSSMFFLSLEKLIADRKSVSIELLKFLGYFPRAEIIDSLQADSLCVNSENVQNVVDYKRNPKLAMMQNTKDMLQTFFYPFNLLLADLLHDSPFTHW